MTVTTYSLSPLPPFFFFLVYCFSRRHFLPPDGWIRGITVSAHYLFLPFLSSSFSADCRHSVSSQTIHFAVAPFWNWREEMMELEESGWNNKPECFFSAKWRVKWNDILVIFTTDLICSLFNFSSSSSSPFIPRSTATCVLSFGHLFVLSFLAVHGQRWWWRLVALSWTIELNQSSGSIFVQVQVV